MAWQEHAHSSMADPFHLWDRDCCKGATATSRMDEVDGGRSAAECTTLMVKVVQHQGFAPRLCETQAARLGTGVYMETWLHATSSTGRSKEKSLQCCSAASGTLQGWEPAHGGSWTAQQQKASVLLQADEHIDHYVMMAVQKAGTIPGYHCSRRFQELRCKRPTACNQWWKRPHSKQ